MTRKEISDDTGVQIARSLVFNKGLEHIELPFNQCK